MVAAYLADHSETRVLDDTDDQSQTGDVLGVVPAAAGTDAAGPQAGHHPTRLCRGTHRWSGPAAASMRGGYGKAGGSGRQAKPARIGWQARSRVIGAPVASTTIWVSSAMG